VGKKTEKKKGRETGRGEKAFRKVSRIKIGVRGEGNVSKGEGS